MNRKRKNENSDDSEIFEDLKNEKIIKVETEEEIEVIQNHYPEEQIIQTIPESEILVLKESFFLVVTVKSKIVRVACKLYLRDILWFRFSGRSHTKCRNHGSSPN